MSKSGGSDDGSGKDPPSGGPDDDDEEEEMDQRIEDEGVKQRVRVTCIDYKS